MTGQAKNGGEAGEMYCSLVSGANGEDPIGTASTHERYLLVEVPPPWEFQAEHSRHFPAGLAAEIRAAADGGRPCRLLAVASDADPSPPGWRRVLFYMRPQAPFVLFGKREYVVPEGQLLALARALLAGDEGGLSAFAAFAAETAAGSRDLFVCTHGRHDRCCGKFGLPLYKEIERSYASRSGGRLRVWRTSHFGGHRHAPTIIDFPEGRYWAHIRPELLDTLLLRRGEVGELARHYRGWAVVGPFEQAAERAAFERIGWDWIAFRKRVHVLERDDMSARIRIDYRSPAGDASGSWEALVSAAARVRTGGCGGEPGEVRQLEVSGLIHRELIGAAEE